MLAAWDTVDPSEHYPPPTAAANADGERTPRAGSAAVSGTEPHVHHRPRPQLDEARVVEGADHPAEIRLEQTRQCCVRDVARADDQQPPLGSGRCDQRIVSTFVLRDHKSSVEQPWRFVRSITALAVVTVLLLLLGFASIALIAGAVVGLLVLLAFVQQGPRRGYRPGGPRS